MLQELMEFIMEADTIYQYIGVFIVSLIPFFESYVAIPIGIVLNFPVIPVVLLSIAGNLLSVYVFIWLVDKLRGTRKSTKNEGSRRKRAQRFFQRYGVPGVSFAGPIICFHVGAAIALGAGTSRQYVTLWQTIAIVVWSVALGIAFAFGVNLFDYFPSLNVFS
ncbi:hypothetical protein J26TS2_32920 [Shouchella clausii]|nr:hypothetical protein J26TS2_32920 [Shouchella clausii]